MNGAPCCLSELYMPLSRLCLQSKKLTDTAKLLKEQANAQAEQMEFRLNQEKEQAAAREASLKELNSGLRQDLNKIMESIPRFIDKRTHEVADEKAMQATIRKEAQEEIKVLSDGFKRMKLLRPSLILLLCF